MVGLWYAPKAGARPSSCANHSGISSPSILQLVSHGTIVLSAENFITWNAFFIVVFFSTFGKNTMKYFMVYFSCNKYIFVYV
jgi:hypothetical protein